MNSNSDFLRSEQLKTHKIALRCRTSARAQFDKTSRELHIALNICALDLCEILLFQGTMSAGAHAQ